MSVTRSQVKIREQLTGHLFVYLARTFTSLVKLEPFYPNSEVNEFSVTAGEWLCPDCGTHPSHFKHCWIPAGVSLGMHALHLGKLHSQCPCPRWLLDTCVLQSSITQKVAAFSHSPACSPERAHAITVCSFRRNFEQLLPCCFTTEQLLLLSLG